MADKFKFVKKVIAGGCSFTHGCELSDYSFDLNQDEVVINASDKTWANHITKNIFPNAILENAAWPGIGYESIVRRIIFQCEKNLKIHKPQDIVVVVMWTSVLRREFVSVSDIKKQNYEEYFLNTLPSDATGRLLINGVPTKDKESLRHRSHIWSKEKLTRTVQTFYNYRNTYDNRIYKALQQLDYLNNYLNNKKIKYFYTCAFDDIRHDHKSENIFIQDLINRTNTKDFFKKNDNGFYVYSKENNFPCGTHADHPLDEAHEFWAKHFSNYILTKGL